MSIFLGYSHKDRYSIVESIIFHIKNYGFNVWYDFHDMFLSDNRETVNFGDGLEKSKYVVFIISENLFNSKCALEELDYARELYEKEKIRLFPIFYNFSPANLSSQYSWLTKIIYNETTNKTGTLFVVNQILEKILYDSLNEFKITSSEIASLAIKGHDKYLYNLLKTLGQLDLHNYNARLWILYSVYLYSINDINLELKYTHCKQVVNRIFNLTSLNLEIDHLSYSLFEKSVLIIVNLFCEARNFSMSSSNIIYNLQNG